jgi:hypothetical protein
VDLAERSYLKNKVRRAFFKIRAAFSYPIETYGKSAITPRIYARFLKSARFFSRRFPTRILAPRWQTPAIYGAIKMPREPLDPNRIFRECDARDLFGFGNTQLKEKIKNGDIPAPHLLSSPPSRARGWWGWQINEWAAHVEKQQAEWAAAVTNEPKAGGTELCADTTKQDATKQ